MAACPVITLTTDFGLADEYVASMKGVIASINPAVQVIDICHQVRAGDIGGAAFLLSRACGFFPPGTIHVAVVDPGVGSERKILAVQAANQVFIGPDNGVLSAAFASPTAVEAVYSVTNGELFRQPVSRTFHGRDIMAPTAAQLSRGLAIKEVGAPLNREDCTIILPPQCRVEEDRIVGAVVHIDHFGNLCTNIPARLMETLLDRGRCTIRIGDFRIRALSSHYSGQASGELLAHFDSHNQLEIAVADGSAAAYTASAVGDEVIVSLK